MTKAATISGVVSSIQTALGAQYPSIVVGGAQIKIAPVWFMIENDFALAGGDAVKVLAAPCLCADPSLLAIEITKGSDTITLRDSLGLPLWSVRTNGQGGGMNPQAPRSGAGCLDAATIQTVAGTVVSVTAGAGIEQPVLVLNTGSATLSIRIGPERVLFASDLELKAGDAVTVKIGASTCDNETLALSLTAGSITVVLRDETGRAVWAR